ncbi:MAG: Rne/Rng family ribonuclease [Pseudomonadota bacterium]
MAKRMLIDANHPEETRVVVVSGNRLEEFDFETSTKKQLKGNIYLAKVMRVEPSLQAAFVDFGGNRHGFLAFNEIHPDYYRLPVADRRALLAGEREDEPAGAMPGGPPAGPAEGVGEPAPEGAAPEPFGGRPVDGPPPETPPPEAPPEAGPPYESGPYEAEPSVDPTAEMLIRRPDDAPPFETPPPAAPSAADWQDGPAAGPSAQFAAPLDAVPASTVESVGGDDIDEVERRPRFRPMRHYKIQEVIKRRQVLLVQVVKEERGTKGAALTTYLSLAGRYCVVMPNTGRGGGISRRIASPQDRKRLKSIMDELDIPDGTAVILRTAGMERSKAEIKRDYEYLMRLWEEVRDLTLKSTAPALVYEEGSLIKRAIRDLYADDIEEILVEGEDGYKAARAFMNMLMPSHVDSVRLYRDPAVPLLQRFQVEDEIDETHSPTVRLKSGAYIVIAATEALVAIDVNSGRATRERHIEETAFKTNLEAADEIARQLRLRDLGGLIVIDFIDMEDQRNQAAVERRLKEAMKRDRARIQIGRISPFGLLELSRQRLRPSLAEVSSEKCPHCDGTGIVRSTESTALHVLRGIEEAGVKQRGAEVTVHVPTAVALYILNQKRAALAGIESRYGFAVTVAQDDALIPPAYRLERGKAWAAEAPVAPAPVRPIIEARGDSVTREPEPAPRLPAATASPEPARDGEPASAEAGVDGIRRRRRPRRGRGEPGASPSQAGRAAPSTPARPSHELAAAPIAADLEAGATPQSTSPQAQAPAGGEARRHGEHPQEGPRRGRRRGRRGGRGRGRRAVEGAPRSDDSPQVDRPIPAPYAPAPYPVDAPQPGAERSGPERHSSPRIEGPGDAHDWPWNRPAERFSAEAGEAPPVAAAPVERAAAEPRRFEPAPDRPAVPPPTVERAPQPPPRQPAAAAPVPEAPKPEAALPPQAEPPAPARQGWWRRLTK